MGKLLPVLLAIIGLGGGVGAGLALRPAPEAAVSNGECPCDCEAMAAQLAAVMPEAMPEGEEAVATSEFVKINNQFVIPVVRETSLSSLVVMSITLEVPLGQTENVYTFEPKLRDRFLQVLFDHANIGGFEGAFTSGPTMASLRQALLEEARRVLGGRIIDVLITDIARQDI